MNENYEKWDELAPRGLVLIGLGLSIIGQAISAKSKRKPIWRWFIMGTIGLVIFNSGIAVFGESIKHRTLYEVTLNDDSN